VLPTRDALHEAFLWSEQRTVTKTATVSLNSNTYEVDAALVGHRVELVFDPFDLTRIQVRLRGVPAGTAIPHRIGRHAHLKARPETPPELPAPTGIDYARLIAEIHLTQLGAPGTGVNYAALAASTPADSNDQRPEQLDLLTDGATTDGSVVS
jgi:putative transposase